MTWQRASGTLWRQVLLRRGRLTRSSAHCRYKDGNITQKVHLWWPEGVEGAPADKLGLILDLDLFVLSRLFLDVDQRGGKFPPSPDYSTIKCLFSSLIGHKAAVCVCQSSYKLFGVNMERRQRGIRSLCLRPGYVYKICKHGDCTVPASLCGWTCSLHCG